MTENDDNQQEEPQQGERKGVRAINLTIPDDTYKRLLIKIRHENLNWKRFFNMMISGFIEDDPMIMQYIDLQMSLIRSKSRTKKLIKEREKMQETIKVFGLDENEIDDIYDMLEEEFEP